MQHSKIQHPKKKKKL